MTTPRQFDVRNAIAAHISAFGYPPTIREIATAIGVTSTSNVSAMLDALEDQGLIRRTTGKARGLVLTEKGWQA